MDTKTTESENITPGVEPVTPPAPAPTPIAAAAPVAPTPSTQGWPDQTPQPTQIQYVIAQKSLDGISGMLLFWIIIFSMTAVGAITSFFMNIFNPTLNSTGSGIVAIVFAPLIAAACIYAVILIATRKKLAINVSIGTIGLMVLQSIVNTIVVSATASTIVDDLSSDFVMNDAVTQTSQSSLVGGTIAVIIVTLMYGGLVTLYFLTSKRVKQTLIK